jgi:integrase/recombinase XerD
MVFKRMMIHIPQGKGKKDRMVPLPVNLLETLRTCYSKYEPTMYLFEGEERATHYSARSVQEVLKRAKGKAGINKKGSIRLLRHSYDTYFLKGGVDIRYIQAFLVRNNL